MHIHMSAGSMHADTRTQAHMMGARVLVMMKLSLICRPAHQPVQHGAVRQGAARRGMAHL